ncbi:MAG: DNA repair exonuclease [Acetobacteraceae bacterium]|nr:DNA repair exonuclease [Acetobacteraceae bacterium]
MSFCFVHAADLHLDTPFAGVGPVPPDLRARLRDASLAAFDHLVELALARDAAFVLLAGGIYDGPERGLRAQVRVRQGLERLAERGIPVVIVAGAGEPAGDWPAIPTWPATVTRVPPGPIRPVPVVRDGQRLATIYGASGAPARAARDLTRVAAPGIHVALLHVPARGLAELGSPDALAARGLDYWALGGEHAARLLTVRQPWLVYPGTTQGRGPDPDELGPKGAMVVPVEDGRVGPPELVPLDAVRVVALEVDLGALPDPAALRAELLASADALRAQHGRDLVVHVVLRDPEAARRGPLSAAATAALLRDLRAAVAGSAPAVWWATLRSAPPAGPSADAIGERTDFAAEVRRLAAELAADPARLRALLGERLTLPPAGTLERAVRPLDEAALAALLRDAEALAVVLLEERDPS